MLSNEKTTLVLVTDAVNAKIFSYNKKKRELLFKTQLDHPEGRLKIHELVSDHPGQYGAGSAVGTFSSDHNPKDNENNFFAKKIADFLDHARTNHEFEEWMIVCSPHFYSLIQKHLNKELVKLMTRHVMKDYMQFTTEELEERLFESE